MTHRQMKLAKKLASFIMDEGIRMQVERELELFGAPSDYHNPVAVNYGDLLDTTKTIVDIATSNFREDEFKVGEHVYFYPVDSPDFTAHHYPGDIKSINVNTDNKETASMVFISQEFGKTQTNHYPHLSDVAKDDNGIPIEPYWDWPGPKE